MYVCAEPVEGFSEDFSVVPVGKYLIVFLLINKPDALIIPILFCYKTLHVSGIFSAHHQEFSTVHSALVSFMQVSMTASKQSQDSTATGVSILTLLGSGRQNLRENYQCRMYSRELLMMGKEDARNM